MAVLGTGAALPGRPIGTEELLARVSARFKLDLVRRGSVFARLLNIRRRHIARDFEARLEGTRPGDGNASLAARAVGAALAQAGLSCDDLGYLIGHTATPAEPLPSNISRVACLLNFRGPVAEFRQACTGFLNATLFAAGLCAMGDGRPVAIVGSETGSVFFDPVRAATESSQLLNFVQMGDGAGAIILAPEQQVRTGRLRRLQHALLDATLEPGLRMRSGGSQDPHSSNGILQFEQNPRLIRDHGADLFRAALADFSAGGHDPNEISHVLPHQANGRMDVLLAPFLPPQTSVIVHADRVGNTGSAAIWLALHEARCNRLHTGDRVLILGAESTNYSYGSCLYEHA